MRYRNSFYVQELRGNNWVTVSDYRTFNQAKRKMCGLVKGSNYHYEIYRVMDEYGRITQLTLGEVEAMLNG